jgi:regulator of protease activity HflC (stomatin/prohibitin superfamily)
VVREGLLTNIPLGRIESSLLHGEKIMKYKFGGTFILLLAGLLVLTIVFGSWYTIDQTQRGVLLRNGALVEVVQPGLHFKWPWTQSG